MVPTPFDRTRLSLREDTMLDLAIEGLTDIQIAQGMAITQSTVNSYWVRVRGKLGQLSRTELVALALKEKSRQELGELQGKLDVLEAESIAHAQMDRDYGNSEMFRAAFDGLPEAAFVCSQTGAILYANLLMELGFGYGPGELIGLPLVQAVTPNVRWKPVEPLIDCFKNLHSLRIGFSEVLYGIRKDGTLFRLILIVNYVPTSEGPIFTGVVHDFRADIDRRREFASSWRFA